jgi:serine O-acetyltransferase
MLFQNLRDEIDATLARDPAARSRLEVVLCYPGFQALLYYRAAHWLWQRRWYLFIDHGMGVVIGETAEVGNDCTLYHGVTLGGTRPSREQGGQKRHPTIGNNVIVGSGSQVLGPFRVGDGARIGAASVVLKEVPEGATMVGNPARQVGLRSAADASPPVFEPYGVTSEIPDPIARPLTALLDEVAALRARVSELEREREAADDSPRAAVEPVRARIARATP